MSNADTYINSFGGLVTDNGHASDEIVIKMTDVSKWYGDFQVLTDCSAHVHKGDVVVVCGPSGSQWTGAFSKGRNHGQWHLSWGAKDQSAQAA